VNDSDNGSDNVDDDALHHIRKSLTGLGSGSGSGSGCGFELDLDLDLQNLDLDLDLDLDAELDVEPWGSQEHPGALRTVRE
jgi:hypothetical protein